MVGAACIIYLNAHFGVFFVKLMVINLRNKDFLTLMFHFGIVNLSNFRSPRGFGQENEFSDELVEN